MYHIRCIGKWFDVKCGDAGGAAPGAARRGRGDADSAPCPTCKREFRCSETTTIFLDVKMEQLMASGAALSQRLDATAPATNRRRSSSGVGGRDEDAGGSDDGRYAECARRLRLERQKLHEALDEGETLKAEIRALRETARTGE